MKKLSNIEIIQLSLLVVLVICWIALPVTLVLAHKEGWAVLFAVLIPLYAVARLSLSGSWDAVKNMYSKIFNPSPVYNYIAYTTPWSEGVIVVREDDEKFPVGYDPIDGGILYSDSLNLIVGIDLIEVVSDINRAVKYDSALYKRHPKDYKEGKLYDQLLSKELDKGLLTLS